MRRSRRCHASAVRIDLPRRPSPARGLRPHRGRDRRAPRPLARPGRGPGRVALPGAAPGALRLATPGARPPSARPSAGGRARTRGPALRRSHSGPARRLLAQRGRRTRRAGAGRPALDGGPSSGRHAPHARGRDRGALRPGPTAVTAAAGPPPDPLRRGGNVAEPRPERAFMRRAGSIPRRADAPRPAAGRPAPRCARSDRWR